MCRWGNGDASTAPLAVQHSAAKLAGEFGCQQIETPVEGMMELEQADGDQELSSSALEMPDARTVEGYSRSPASPDAFFQESYPVEQVGPSGESIEMEATDATAS
jgi:hypothetical protein